MHEVWVMKQIVLRARDEQGLARRLHSFENALRLRDGSILEVERPERHRRMRHVALIRYELPLPAVTSASRRVVSSVLRTSSVAR